jgi:L-methionine (R)-S-oxide reductase
MKMIDFKQMLLDVSSLLEEQPNQIALLANASAFIFEFIPDLNWAGFYLYDGTDLKVGPFQGRVACSTIALGKGVCGEVALELKTKVVDDVLNYSNHIACDHNSRSEVVIPIVVNNVLYGVLDIDSPVLNRFDSDLVSFLEEFVLKLVKFIDNSQSLG